MDMNAVTTQVGPIPSLSGPAKLAEVTRLMGILADDLDKKNLLPPHRNAVLEELKPYARSIENLEPMLSVSGMRVLCGHSFDGNSLTTARAALRCLANVMLLEASTRQTFVNLNYARKAAERLKSDNREDELLASRLLFLATYNTTLDFEELFTKDQLAESINTHLYHHAKVYSRATSKNPVPAINVSALSETLKLVFNLTQYYPQHAPTFTKSLLSILKILGNIKISTPPLQPPVTYLINSLLNLDLEDKKARHFTQNPLFPLFSPTCNVDRLISILDAAVHQYKEEQLEQLAVPLVTIIRKIHDFAPEAVKLHMRCLLLPSNNERVQPLGKSDSLSAFLLRISTSPVAPSLRETLSNLLFDLSDRDATSFVRNVGYGFASGFLLTHDLPVPENATQAWSTEAGEKREPDTVDPSEKVTVVDGVEINPVTGQRRDMEPKLSEIEMTEEEKEREAERLFILFERLRATGVVNVQNPITQAKQEGRFEELE